LGRDDDDDDDDDDDFRRVLGCWTIGLFAWLRGPSPFVSSSPRIRAAESLSAAAVAVVVAFSRRCAWRGRRRRRRKRRRWTTLDDDMMVMFLSLCLSLPYNLFDTKILSDQFLNYLNMIP